MRKYTIHSKNQTNPIFSGNFLTFSNCLEAAISDNVNLNHADLSNQNLSNANLDDAKLKYANFKGTNLTGANLSEAQLQGSDFSNAALFNTCMAYSQLQNCQFHFSRFGGTDMTASDLSFSHFKGLSFFKLNFADLYAMHDCTFQNAQDQIVKTSQPPIVIMGIKPKPLILIYSEETNKNIALYG